MSELNLEQITQDDKIGSSLLVKLNNNIQKIDDAYGTLADNLLEKTGQTTISEAIESIENLVDTSDGTITTDKVVNGYIGYANKNRIVGTAFSTTTNVSSSSLLSGYTAYKNDGTLINGGITSKAGATQTATGTLNGNNYEMTIPATGYYTTASKLSRTKSNVISDLGATLQPTINVTLGGNASYKGYISGYGAGIDHNGVLTIWATSNTVSYEHINFVNTSIGVGTIGVGWNNATFSTSGDPAGLPHACTVTGITGKSTIDITLNASTINATYDYVTLQVTITAS